MFAEVLNDEFLLWAAERTRLYLEKVVEQWDQPDPIPFDENIDDGPLAFFFVDEDIDDELSANISADGIREVINELDHASVELQNERDQETARICIPSIPILAILQSQLTRAFAFRPSAHPRLDNVFDEGIAENIDVNLGGMVAMRVRGPYEVTDRWYLNDPRWLWMEVVKFFYKFKSRVTFGGVPESAIDIADNARIILVGDWGSGIQRAQDVAGKIRKILTAVPDDSKEQYVIHLGDVYLMGAKEEYRNNFLQHWPVRHGEPFGSFIVCGNHDMYQGGHEYYGTALADSRFAQQAGKSVFALRNANWQFLGIDTAYEEKRLSNGQDKWIKSQLRTTGNRRTTILSHHPLWSDYKPSIGADLRNQIGPILAEGQRKIDAWFWGHEHRCVVYEPRDPVHFTSCVGHGGIPSYLKATASDPYPPNVKYEYRQRYGPGPQPWNTFGFAVIDLDRRDMHVRYIDEFGITHRHEHV
jgi:hypothetical protein